MKFGRKLQALRYEPWSRYYLDYDRLKEILEHPEEFMDVSQDLSQSLHSAFTEGYRYAEELDDKVTTTFMTELNQQVKTVVLFFLKQQGVVASQLENLLVAQEELAAASTLDHSDHETSVTEVAVEELSEQLYETAQLLLRVIQFKELNLTGLRKILKKHDKLYHNHRLSATYLNVPKNSALMAMDQDGPRVALLAPLLEENDGLSTLIVTLEALYWQLAFLFPTAATASIASPRRSHVRSNTLPPEFYQQEADDRPAPPPPRNAPPIQHFSSSSPLWAAIMTPQFGGRTSRHKTHHALLASRQNSLAVGSGLDSYRKTYPILLKITAARQRLHQTSNFVKMLASTMLVSGESMTPDASVTEEEELEQDLFFEEEEDGRVISNWLNLLSTCLYMTNYYIVAPTSASYASKLGADPAVSGLIIGATPVSALASTLLYSWWTTHYSYKHAVMFAASCSLLGNLLYALGLPCNSLSLVLVGRLLNGFGSARSINRRYIADVFSKQDRTAASAAFVTAGALGMAAGPAIASLLHVTVTNKWNVYWQVENCPGWFMAGVWTLFLACMMRFFRDPPKRGPPKEIELTGEQRPLLSAGKSGSNGVAARSSSLLSVVPEQALLSNIPVVITFFIYFVLKLVLETSLSSVATITDYYFEWPSSLGGVYLACLGLLMLPANLGVGYLARRFEDRELMVGMQILMLAGCLGVMKYTELYTTVQYVCASVAIFVGTNALEGPNMSLLSKTIPKSWSHGFFNVGLLSTEAGTLGRAVADVLLTACGSGSLDRLLNSVFGIMSTLSLISLGLTWRFFDYLEPHEKDD